MASGNGTSKGLGGMQPKKVMESERRKNGWFWPVSAGTGSSSLSCKVEPERKTKPRQDTLKDNKQLTWHLLHLSFVLWLVSSSFSCSESSLSKPRSRISRFLQVRNEQWSTSMFMQRKLLLKWRNSFSHEPTRLNSSAHFQITFFCPSVGYLKWSAGSWP